MYGSAHTDRRWARHSNRVLWLRRSVVQVGYCVGVGNLRGVGLVERYRDLPTLLHLLTRTLLDQNGSLGRKRTPRMLFDCTAVICRSQKSDSPPSSLLTLYRRVTIQNCLACIAKGLKNVSHSGSSRSMIKSPSAVTTLPTTERKKTRQKSRSCQSMFERKTIG